MATSVVDLVNQAIRVYGGRKRIADIYEGSPEARAALEVFGQTRDELLRAEDWPFARAAGVALTLLKGPPPPGGYNPATPWTTVYPASGWLWEYAYPADCLDLLAITKPPRFLPVLDPRPQTWRIDNDLTPIVVAGVPPSVTGPPQKVILTNAYQAQAVYRRRVTNPALWEPGYTAAFVQSLARKMPGAMASPQMQQMIGQEAAATAVAADQKRG